MGEQFVSAKFVEAVGFAHVSDEEFARQVKGYTPKQKKALAREIRALLAQVKREMASIKRERNGELALIRRRCRTARSAIRTEKRAALNAYRRRVAELKEQDRAAVKACSEEILRLEKEARTTRGPKEALIQRLQSLRGKLASMTSGPTTAKVRGGSKAREKREESDQATGNDLDGALPGAGKWWTDKGRKMREFAPKNVPPRKSRAAHVLESLRAHPEIIYAWQEQKAEQDMAEKAREEKALQKKLERLSVQQNVRRRGVMRRVAASVRRGSATSKFVPFLGVC